MPRRAAGRTYGAYIVAMLFLTHVLSHVDRMALAVLLPAIKVDFTLSDVELGLITGIAFSLSYALVGLPIARIAALANRPNIVGAAVITRCFMTASSARSGTFGSVMPTSNGRGAGTGG